MKWLISPSKMTLDWKVHVSECFCQYMLCYWPNYFPLLYHISLKKKWVHLTYRYYISIWPPPFEDQTESHPHLSFLPFFKTARNGSTPHQEWSHWKNLKAKFPNFKASIRTGIFFTLDDHWLPLASIPSTLDDHYIVFDLTHSSNQHHSR